jgi:hypothetical protein
VVALRKISAPVPAPYYGQITGKLRALTGITDTCRSSQDIDKINYYVLQVMIQMRFQNAGGQMAVVFISLEVY